MSDARTWLTIEGARYDLHSAIRQPAIRDLVDLKRATQVDGAKGIAIKTIADTMLAMGELFKGLGDEPTAEQTQAATLEFFDDVDTLLVFAALVFLAKRKAGEGISFADATGYSVFDIGFDIENEGESDPKDLSTPVGDGVAGPATI